MKKHNFSAGPCILPQEVFDKTAQAVLNLNNSGLSVMEISHRSADGKHIIEQAISLTKELLNVPDTHEVLFLQGGATMQFGMVPMNLLPQNGKAVYLDTGSWAAKAAKDAAKIGETQLVASSKDQNYNYIPKGYTVPKDATYFHFTSNNTIFGTQIKDFPFADCLNVCDMSSDILSKEINVADFDLIYAGAQKNMGPAGATLVVIKKDILGKTDRAIPSYLDYQIHIDKDSAFNTWPVLSVFGIVKNLEWLKAKGGVAVLEKENNAKAKLLYDEIDRNPLFKGTAATEDRSWMNATFVLNNEEHKEAFNQLWNQAGITNLNGHRSVGGYRASMYNALPIESVQVLVNVMQELEQKIK